jgi:hypothetical protein
MALVIDPDDLNEGTEVDIDGVAKTITLNIAGNLSADGVTGQCLYSFLKLRWKANANLTPIPFPMVAITPESFEFVSGWEPEDDATRKLLRQCGWAEVAVGGAVKRRYFGAITLGNIDATSKTVGDKAYYFAAGDTSRTEFTYAGPVDEAIQYFGDASNGNFDNTSTVYTLAIRQEGKTFGASTTTAIGLSSLSPIAYRFPVSEATDLKITETDANIATQAPYTGMSIEWYATPQSRNIGGANYDFSIIIDGNNATAEQIYEFIQYQLRQDADIDDGTGNENGYLTDQLLAFTGDALSTNLVAGDGVYIDNFDSNDTNRLTFVDDTGTDRVFPFVAAGSLNFSDTLVNDTAGEYWLYFTTNPGGDFGTSSAILVDNNAGTDITGSISAASISFDFDYDGNNQGGRTPGTDADVTLVAIGLDGAQYVVATGTITRTTGISITATAGLERNYSNP